MVSVIRRLFRKSLRFTGRSRKLLRFEEIIERIKEFRDKPKEEPLSKAEGLIAMYCYFEQLKGR
jgi:hypothetical protein